MNFLNEDYQQALSSLGESGVDWIDAVFRVCVMLLVDLANLVGMTYEEVNILIFVVIWPILTLYQAIRISFLKRKVTRISAPKELV